MKSVGSGASNVKKVSVSSLLGSVGLFISDTDQINNARKTLKDSSIYDESTLAMAARKREYALANETIRKSKISFEQSDAALAACIAGMK